MVNKNFGSVRGLANTCGSSLDYSGLRIKTDLNLGAYGGCIQHLALIQISCVEKCKTGRTRRTPHSRPFNVVPVRGASETTAVSQIGRNRRGTGPRHGGPSGPLLYTVLPMVRPGVLLLSDTGEGNNNEASIVSHFCASYRFDVTKRLHCRITGWPGLRGTW
jgi:hypothetical protein